MKAFTVLNTNTKNRRLGYLLWIVREVGKGISGPEALRDRLVSWAEAHSKSLEKHIDPSGRIQRSFKNTSASRYISFALETGLISKLHREFRLTKYGKVLFFVTQKKSGDPFYLTESEICFLLHWLLNTDSDYLIPMFHLMSSKKETTLSFFQDGFVSAVTKWIKIKSKYLHKERSELLHILDRIKQWRRPKKYIEHIVPPRVNWFLDLELIDWNVYRTKAKIRMSRKGERFLENFPQEANFQYFDYTNLKNEYFKWFLKAFSRKQSLISFSELGLSRKKIILSRYLRKCFELFGTEEIERVAASQFLHYTCLKLAVEEKVACGFEDLKQGLRAVMSSDYYFYWSEEQNDGYIVKI